MKTAHQGMGITNAEFDALVGDLVGALDKFKVGAKEKDELLALLGPMRKDIVEKK
jgi:hemoglobin